MAACGPVSVVQCGASGGQDTMLPAAPRLSVDLCGGVREGGGG